MTIRRPSDYHLHVRQGERMRQWAPYSADFGRVLVMPNTVPPILTGAQAAAYKAEAEVALPGVDVIPTIQITPQTTPSMIWEAREVYGVRAGKAYPKNLTSNSEYGFAAHEYTLAHPIWESMERAQMMLLVHGEMPGEDIYFLDRELRFLEILNWLIRNFSNLRIVMEHVTTRSAVNVIKNSGANLAGTITPHHLVLTTNDVLEPKLRPHYYCKPIAKRFEDRQALVDEVVAGNSKFFLGTDSAPWKRGEKECDCACAGVFSAPVAMAFLAQFFSRHGILSQLENFTSTFGDDFYRLPHIDSQLTLEEGDFPVPSEYDGEVVPFCAGQTLGWRVAKEAYV